MFSDEIKEIKSTQKELREFGFVMTTAFFVFGLIGYFNHKAIHMPLFGGALLFLIAALFYPKILKPLQKVWMTFAIILGWFTSRIILSFLFYLVFPIVGGLGKLSGTRFLDVKLEKSKDSYWVRRTDKCKPKESYCKQY